MKFTVFLTGLLLLFLLPDWTESVENTEDTVDINTLATVDINTLTRIINFFEQNYKRGTEEDPRQYAIAINVPKEQCKQNFFPEKNNFLTQENAAIVRENITDDSKALYQGEELIAAGTKKDVDEQKFKMHSEFLLLNPANNSPLSNLLNKRKKDGCSVFYTFNSPCVKTCLNATGSHNIINALENWKQHDGIKAFVFKNFWKFDIKKDLQDDFKQIVAHVPLFHCKNQNECYACNGEGNTPIDAHCLPLKKTNIEL